MEELKQTNQINEIDLKTLNKAKSLGKFIRIIHFNSLFNMIHEFIGDIKNFITLININKYFRKTMKFSPKIVDVINSIKIEKYKIFSPYSWVSSKAHYFDKYKEEFVTKYDLNDYEFKILFNLSKRMINKLDFETFDISPQFNSIFNSYFYNQFVVKEVNFSFCKFESTEEQEKIIQFIGKCYNIEKINFEENVLIASNCKAIKNNWSKLKFLKEVNLKGCKVGIAGSSHIADFLADSISIETLNLSLNSIETFGLKAISSSQGIKNLKYLNLGSNTSINGFEEFFDNLLKNDTINLTNLYLNSVKFNDSDCQHASNFIASNKTLQVLSLYDNNITAIGFGAIIVSLTMNNTLESIDFSRNSLLQDSKTDKHVDLVFHNFLELYPCLRLSILYMESIGSIDEKMQDTIIKKMKVYVQVHPTVFLYIP